jgi:hypothetical protein
MNELSFPPTSLPSANASQWANQMQESIQAFLNWIDSVEIHSNRVSQSRQADNRTARRNTGFTNGPYAEIKESIGRLK